MPVNYTCLGDNINPPLVFGDVPDDVASFVLIFEDLDADPQWTHWMLFNVPPLIRSVDEGSIPAGATEGLANNHSFGYEGPCPKFFAGTHRYRFRLFALDKLLDLGADSERDAVESAMQSHIITEAFLEVICVSPSQVLQDDQ